MRLRLSVLQFLQWAIPGSLVPLFSLRLHGLGFSEMEIALCCATQAAATVLSSLVAGQLADRWLAAERALSLCAILAGVDLFLLSYLTTPVAVFCATLGFWLLAGPMILLGTTISFSHLKRPEKEFGPVRMWGTVGWMSTGWIMGIWLRFPQAILADAFRLGGMIAVVLACFAWTLPHTPPRLQSPHRLAPLAALKLFRNPSFVVYTFCVLGACITFPFTTQNTPLLLNELGVEREWLGPTLTVAQGSEVLLLWMLPAMMQHLGVRGTMLLGLSAWVCAMTVLAVGEPLWLVVVSMNLNGLYVAGFLVAGQVYINSQSEGDLRTSAQGIFNFINGLGLLAGNLLAGWLRRQMDGDLPRTFAVAALITLGLLVVFLVCFHEKRGEPAHDGYH